MNPYRLVFSTHPSRMLATCLDAPRDACATPPSSRPPNARARAVLGVTLGLMVLLLPYAAHALGNRGHVEIGPAAIAHARAKSARHDKPRDKKPAQQAAARAPSSTPRSPRRPEVSWIAGSHAPTTLVARAKELASFGLDVSVVDVHLSRPLADFPQTRAGVFPTDTTPLRNSLDHVDSLEIHGLSDASPLRVAGLENGDELLGIDGYRFDDDSFKNVDIATIRARGAMVVELARAHHHVLLSVRWPTAP